MDHVLADRRPFLLLLRIEIAEHGGGDPPALPRSRIPADLQERRHTPQPPESLRIREQNFAAPDCAVLPISGPVKGQPDHRFHPVVFRHTGQNMSIMVLHRHHRNVRLRRQSMGNRRGMVPRMQITDHKLRPCLEQGLKPADRLLQGRAASRVLQISDIRGRIEQPPSADTERILEFSAHGKYRAPPRDSPLRIGQQIRKRRISPRPTDHVRLPLTEIHHGVVAAGQNLPVI